MLAEHQLTELFIIGSLCISPFIKSYTGDYSQESMDDYFNSISNVADTYIEYFQTHPQEITGYRGCDIAIAMLNEILISPEMEKDIKMNKALNISSHAIMAILIINNFILIAIVIIVTCIWCGCECVKKIKYRDQQLGEPLMEQHH